MLHHGEHEGLKAALHASAGLLVGIFCVYNAAAFVTRDKREWHLARNAVLYGGLTIYEALKVRRHLCERS